MGPDFIKSAIKKPGAMSASASKGGVSNSQYEQEHKGDSGKSGQRARFAVMLKGLGGKKGQ